MAKYAKNIRIKCKSIKKCYFCIKMFLALSSIPRAHVVYISSVLRGTLVEMF